MEASDGQAQRPRSTAAAADFSDTVYNNAEADYSDTAILSHGPVGDADPNFSSTSVGQAGEQHYSASNQAQAAADAAPVERRATFVHSSAARPNAAAPSQSLTNRPWLRNASLLSTPPLASDAGTAVLNEVPQAQPAHLCQSNTSAASASIASGQSNYSNSSSSLQGNSTAVHTASSSPSGTYTKADSTVSKACSSPRQQGINTRHPQPQSQQDAPHLAVKPGVLHMGKDLHSASRHPAPPTDIPALAASQVCARALVCVDLEDTLAFAADS